ncbi:1688_t:CDS:2 [Funneliformis mosseae]|uniref:1688_t:CDS:1 n=1 Tax=Funneliformis mosseae TaxID=27381 RepID=A0A9N8VCR9_FUNMO|nr:1688_t:CDS:2 [Funneliformis mosseae]
MATVSAVNGSSQFPKSQNSVLPWGLGRGDKGKDIHLHLSVVLELGEMLSQQPCRIIGIVVAFLKDNFLVETKGQGDKRIDMRGHMNGKRFMGQCKAWKKRKIGTLSNEPWPMIGVVVGLSKDTFTSSAVKAVEELGIIITDSDHLYDDLSVVAG